MTGLGVVTACAMGVVGIAIGTTLLNLTDSKREAAMKQFLKRQCSTEVNQTELTDQNRYKAQTILRMSPHVKAACASFS
jgi:tartrate dehydratase alpha subunit/fumarate hydratase class I-like protein